MLKNLRSILLYKSFVLTVATTCFLNCALANQIARSQDLDKRISIDVEKKTLKETLDQISKQIHVGIIYSNAKGILKNPVTIHAKDQPVSKVLSELLSPLTLTYEIIGGQIVVKYDNISSRPPSQKQSEKQKYPIKGKVTDVNSLPLPGATIKIKDGPALATTDNNGEFLINNVSDSTILQVSFLGYVTKEILVTNANYLTVKLENGSNQLNEVAVVSTGYQTIPRERATGSFSQPIKAEFDTRVSTDVLSKLDGITSGLLFNSNTNSTLSGKLDINVRGRSTIFANDQPLIVVDNFPYSGDISNINPNDVENVSILKDAAAASIWGVRAGNGVIVITTKRGRTNSPLDISFNSNLTVQQRPNLKYDPNFLSTSDFIDVEQFLFSKGKYDSDLKNTTSFKPVSPVVEILAKQRSGTISQSDATAQIDALRNNDIRNDLSKYFYRNAIKQQYALTLSGGSEKGNYFLSTGYDKNLQSQVDNDYERITINSRNTFNVLKNLQVYADINYVKNSTKTDNTLSQITTGGNYSGIYPYATLADANGNLLSIVKLYRGSFVQGAVPSGYQDWSFYPLKELGLANNTTKYSDIRLNPGIKYTIFKGLSIDLKYQYENYSTDHRDLESPQTFYTRNLINQYSVLSGGKVTGYNIPLGGILNQATTNVISNNIRGQINYSNNWGKSAIDAIAGVEQNETITDGHSDATLYGYNDDTGNFTNVSYVTSYTRNPSAGSAIIPNAAGITGLIDRVRSKFANIAYTYDGKYILSSSGRIDGSNYFGVNTNLKNVPLWSIGGKWIIDRESFFKLDWLPSLSLRSTFGYNGNLNRNITGVTTFRYSTSAGYWTNLPYATISNVGNPDLTWERSGITNFGLDFGTKNNRITGSFDYYLKNGKNLIGDESLAPSSGVTLYRGNFANTTGRGFDIQITSKNIDQTFKWSTTLLFSHAADKVTHYNAPVIASTAVAANGTGATISPFEGYPVFSIWSYKWAGLDPATGDPQGIDNKGNISKDYSALTNPDSLKRLKYSGSARPLYFGAINNVFSYRGFSLLINISYKFGYYFRRGALNYSGLFNNWTGQNTEFAQRWQKPGDEKTTNVPSMVYPANSSRDIFYQFSEATVEKGDNIRLQDISLSYDLTSKILGKSAIKSLSIYTYANNLAIIWRANKLGLDPDYPTGYPVPKSISFGIKAHF